MKPRFQLLVFPGLLLLLLALLTATTSADAANYVVANNADSGPGSLRQAILDANAGGGGNISLSNVSGAIVLKSGLASLTANITISGPGAAELALSNSFNMAVAILTNSTANTAAITGLTIDGSVNNGGTLALVDLLIGNRFAPGQAGFYNAGTATVSRCTFTLNSVPNGAADAIENYGTISIDHSSITNNKGGDGSIYNTANMTIDDSVIAGHTWFTSSDGGIVNAGGSVVLRNCSISNNWAIEGGGINNGGSLAMTNCTINGNRVFYSEPGERGGGLFNIGYAILENTTISGNSASGNGGGIWNGGSLKLLNCTIASNTVSSGTQPSMGAGIWNDGQAVSQSKNSIIAGNQSSGGTYPLGPDDIGGNFQSLGHNLVLGTNGWPQAGYNNTDLLGVDPQLGPLQDNGGLTWTHALAQGSPAIDAGDPNGAPADDQRGVPRPQGPGIDIGALEVQYATTPFFASLQVQSRTNLSFRATGTPFASYLLQVSSDFVSWDTLCTVTCPASGILQFTQPMTSSPQAFFRLRSQTQ